MLGLKLIHVSKRGPWWFSFELSNTPSFALEDQVKVALCYWCVTISTTPWFNMVHSHTNSQSAAVLFGQFEWHLASENTCTIIISQINFVPNLAVSGLTPNADKLFASTTVTMFMSPLNTGLSFERLMFYQAGKRNADLMCIHKVANQTEYRYNVLYKSWQWRHN